MKHGQGFDPFNKTFINNRLTDQALSNIGGSASDFFRLKYECAEARSGFGRVQFDERIMEEVKKAGPRRGMTPKSSGRGWQMLKSILLS